MAIKVLWIDDEPWTLRHEQILAANRGWEITPVETAADAEELIGTEKFDLVILDLILHRDQYNKDRGVADSDVGVQLLRTIRQPGRQGLTPWNVRLLVVTCVVSVDVEAEVIRTLASEADYVRKPIASDFSTIVDRVTGELQATSTSSPKEAP